MNGAKTGKDVGILHFNTFKPEHLTRQLFHARGHGEGAPFIIGEQKTKSPADSDFKSFVHETLLHITVPPYATV